MFPVQWLTGLLEKQCSWDVALPNGSVSTAGVLLWPVCSVVSVPSCIVLHGHALRFSSGVTTRVSRTMIYMHWDSSQRSANVTA